MISQKKKKKKNSGYTGLHLVHTTTHIRMLILASHVIAGMMVIKKLQSPERNGQGTIP